MILPSVEVNFSGDFVEYGFCPTATFTCSEAHSKPYCTHYSVVFTSHTYIFFFYREWFFSAFSWWWLEQYDEYVCNIIIWEFTIYWCAFHVMGARRGKWEYPLSIFFKTPYLAFQRSMIATLALPPGVRYVLKSYAREFHVCRNLLKPVELYSKLIKDWQK